jgi:hypothetical protein
MRMPQCIRAPGGALLICAIVAVGTAGAAEGRARAASGPHPIITAAPLTVNRGGLVTVSGANFTPKEAINLYFVAAPKMVTPATADANGLLPPTGVSVPYSIGAGPRRLVAYGAVSKSQAQVLLTILNITPTIALSSAYVKPGQTVTVRGRGFATRERVTVALNGAALGTAPPVITTTNGAFQASFTVPSRLLAGANTVSAVGNASRVAAVSPLTGTLPIASQFYFAGGLNTSTAHAFVDILNPNAEVASVTLTFYFDNGTTGHESYAVPAHTMKTVSVADYNFPAGTFGLTLRANRAVSAQITINRDGKDGDGLLGNTGLGTRWYLAEGYTGLTFHETVSVLNPAATPATVQLQILPLGGGTAKTVNVTAAPHSNLVSDINALEPGRSVSIIATSNIPVVVERTLTFSNNGYGMTTSAGSNTPATTWIFAEGTTANHFQTFLTILNPNTVPTQVTASFFGQTGGSLGSRTLVVAGLSRANIKLNDFLNASGIASVVTSNLPVVVERPEYFGSPNDAGIAGSDVFGQNGAAVRASFPGGSTQGTDEYLLVYNPSAATVPIDVTFYGADHATVPKRIYVTPTARYNINVNTFVPGFDASHGAILQSASGLGFVAEQTVFAPNYSSLRSTQALAQ